MRDINGEEFFVGDTLKVIKEGFGFGVGTLVVCSYDDGSDSCRFSKVGEGPEGDTRWMTNDRLQKV